MPVAQEEHRKYGETTGVFRKEALVYQNLLSEFLGSVSKPFCAQYYYSKNDECLVLEDLNRIGFEVIKRNEGLYFNDDQVQSFLRTLARFHAGSLIFEEIRSTPSNKFRIGDHYCEEIMETSFSFVEGHPRNMWYVTVMECLGEMRKYYSEEEEISIKLKKYMLDVLPQMIKPSKKFRNVLAHDDLWRNNILFNKENDCLLVDFQMVRYSPPIFDILLFLYINLKQEIVKKNLLDYLDIYYEVLKQELTRHNLIPQEVLSKQEILESVAFYDIAVLVEAAMYGTCVYLSDELDALISSNFEDVFIEFMKNRTPLAMKEFESNKQYKERLSNLLIPIYNKFSS